jgi:ATP-dependent 26S proteasome regulatory subunit
VLTEPTAIRPFVAAAEHARALVEVTRLMVARLVMVRGGDAPPRRPDRVSAHDVVATAAGRVTPVEMAARSRALDETIEHAFAIIDRRAEATDRGLALPWRALVEAFELDRLDQRIVAALLAMELDPELGRALTALGDDPARRRPEVGLLTELVAGADDELRNRAYDRLGPDGRLRRERVVTLGAGEQPYVLRSVRLADRIAHHLRGHDAVDESLAGIARVVAAEPEAAIILGDDLRQRLTAALTAPRARVLVTGPDDIGKGAACAAILGGRGVAVVRAELRPLLGETPAHDERLGALFREQALRRGAAILLDLTQAPDAIDAAVAGRLRERIAAARGPVVVFGARRPDWLASIVHPVEIAMPVADFDQRVTLWRRALDGEGARAADADLETVAGRYALGGAAIHRAAHGAAGAAQLAAGAAVSLDQLSEAARRTFSVRLGGVAQRISSSFTWDDLVLAPGPIEQLREVVTFARLRPYLLERWGFARKLPYGRGVSVMMAGPPGTGKTMAAQILAAELGYDLYRIDLSQVVNKYVGETEKNLARVFDEAEASHAVLFFDEADALFARRTDVRSANDRYANLEVNYLLQRMETYDGVTLLATNLEQGIDDAFRRRVRFAIELDMPETDERERLWRSMIPAEAPLAADVDWRALAAAFELAGAYIKRAVVRAALMAVSDGGRPIRHADLLAAARQEYRDMGRVSGGI